MRAFTLPFVRRRSAHLRMETSERDVSVLVRASLFTRPARRHVDDTRRRLNLTSWRHGRRQANQQGDKKREIPTALLDRVRSLASTTQKHRDSISARHRGRGEVEYESDDSDE